MSAIIVRGRPETNDIGQAPMRRKRTEALEIKRLHKRACGRFRRAWRAHD